MNKILIIALVILTNVSAQLLLRAGMKNIEINGVSLSLVTKILNSYHVWFGMFMYVISFALYLYILSEFEVGYVYPVIMSIGFILILIFSTLFLGETFSLLKFIGIIFISIGIWFLS